MKVIRKGKRNFGSFRFKCERCGCRYSADVNDYYFTTMYGNPSKDNEPTRHISCECPNCGKTNIKDIYKNHVKDFINKIIEKDCFSDATSIIFWIWRVFAWIIALGFLIGTYDKLDSGDISLIEIALIIDGVLLIVKGLHDS